MTRPTMRVKALRNGDGQDMPDGVRQRMQVLSNLSERFGFDIMNRGGISFRG
jgi:hypothetical protein